MSTSDKKGPGFSIGEDISSQGEENSLYFSEWLKHRRQELDLTQEQLARRASCSVFAIRKIELGERRPSRQLAGLLAQSLEIPGEDQAAFIKAARSELSMERFAAPVRLHSQGSQPPARPGPVPGNPPGAGLPGESSARASFPGESSPRASFPGESSARTSFPGESLPKASFPRTLTPFIGREPELAALGQLLCDPQCLLLTIVGPGGIGKTRLAIEAANQSIDLFPHGVWFVPLSGVNTPALLVPAIADALNFRFQDPTNPQAQLLNYLREKKTLLILDNAEHLLDGFGLLPEILNACPQVKLLVTSRERINLLSEWVFELLGLPVPASDQVEQFESYSSVALFLQCAKRVRAGFELRQEERRWVLKICQIMEGMPLGLELAAAWVGLLPCEEIATEIERNIDFLTVSMRDLPERHRSLRATLDHSWKLLNAEEKRILSRLSVFYGSFRREAAQEICGASLAVLSSFQNKMLLYRREQDFYSLHELIRQYAELKLKEDPAEDERVKDRHAAYYVRCLAGWEQALKGSRQAETCSEIAQGVGNLARGWQRMVASIRPETLKDGQFQTGLLHSSLFSLSLFYEMRHRSLEAIALFKEAAAYLKRMQRAFEESPLFEKSPAFEKSENYPVFSSILGHLTAYLGLHHIFILQNEQAQAYLEEALALLAPDQARVERAQAQVMLSVIYLAQGQLQKTADLLEQSREVFREEGEVWWYLLATVNLASPYISLRKLEQSEALLQEGFGLIEPGDLRLGLPLRLNYAYLLNLKQEFGRAEQLLQETLQLSHQLEDSGQTSGILFDLGRLALATRQMEKAEAYILESINILSDFEQFIDLSMNRLYLGKCFAARHDLRAAREQFRQVIKRGQALDNPAMVYWGLVSTASVYMEEGQTEKALEIGLALRHYPIEFIRMKEDGDRLLADLRASLPPGQVEAAMRQVDSQVSADLAGANALAYALECEKK